VAARRLGLQLQSMGATVWHYDDPLIKYHAKYLVSDAGVALVGTFNLTRKCFRKTCDFVVSYDPAVVDGLDKLFHADCRRQALSGGLTERLLVAPDAARDRLSALIGRATRHIRVIDAELDDPQVIALLTERQQNGVRVDVVTGNGSFAAPWQDAHHRRRYATWQHVAVARIAGLPPRSRDVIDEPAQSELIDVFHGPPGSTRCRCSRPARETRSVRRLSALLPRDARAAPPRTRSNRSHRRR
jgi:hypothetical protein